MILSVYGRRVFTAIDGWILTCNVTDLTMSYNIRCKSIKQYIYPNVIKSISTLQMYLPGFSAFPCFVPGPVHRADAGILSATMMTLIIFVKNWRLVCWITVLFYHFMERESWRYFGDQIEWWHWYPRKQLKSLSHPGIPGVPQPPPAADSCSSDNFWTTF